MNGAEDRGLAPAPFGANLIGEKSVASPTERAISWLGRYWHSPSQDGGLGRPAIWRLAMRSVPTSQRRRAS